MGCKSSKAADAPKPVAAPQDAEPKQEAPPPTEPDVAKGSKDAKEAAKGLKPGDSVTVSKDGGIEGKVLSLTTTDVLVKITKDNKEKWYEIEDVQRWSNSPPLATEVKVGEAVTTSDGFAGTVTKRTTTDVCLRDADGKEKWYDIADLTVIKVTIIGAVGLRNADWVGKSDPYVSCQLKDKPRSKVQTHAIKDCLDPIWDFEARIVGYATGDPLEFEVYDRDTMKLKSDDFLGQVALPSEQFHSSVFMGELPLLESSGKPAKGVLKLKVEVVSPPPALSEEPVQLEDLDPSPFPAEPEVTEVKQSSSGWCC